VAAPSETPAGSNRLWAWPDPLETAAVFAVIGFAIALVEFLYSQAPVPPGVDPGDWIQRSYAWVGLAHPPAYAVGSPFLYPPLLFPILGALRLATGSPLTTGFLFGGLVLALYGLTLWHLARVTLVVPSLRVALVGLGLLNGTVLSMLFWGGYPNLLAFVFVNEAAAYLVLSLRHRTPLPTILMWLFVTMTFLTHTLTFDLTLAFVVLSILLALATQAIPWRYVLARGTILGVALLVVTYAGYTLVLDYLKVPRIDYLHANPATFDLAGLGTTFGPLARAPAFWPMGPAVTLSNLGAAGVLGFAGGAVLCLALALPVLRPARWEFPTVVTGAWAAVMLLAPVGGYLAHIDTDYPRFVYFLPLPLAALALVCAEGALPAALRGGPTPPSRDGASSPRRHLRLIRPGLRSSVLAVLVALGLALLSVTVSIPTVALADQGSGLADHDAAFLAAAKYLAANPAPGSVLTVQGTARWLEALTNRGAFDPGPTWLEFEPWQITNAQEAYFATNSLTGVTNNLVAASYSGYASGSVSEAPLITALVEGVPIPILRIVPASEWTESSGPACTGWEPAAGNGLPALRVPGPTPESGVVRESNDCASVVQATTIAPTAPTIWINYTITPVAGSQLTAFNVTLGSPASHVGPLHAANVTTVATVGSRLIWSVATLPGQFPGGASLSLSGTVSPTPSASNATSLNKTGSASYVFDNPDPSEPLEVSFELTIPGTSNPAVVLPTLLSTAQYLAMNSIHFLLLPTSTSYAQTIAFLSSSFQFLQVYQNPEWIVLESS